jgi:hypothetical protein
MRSNTWLRLSVAALLLASGAAHADSRAATILVPGLPLPGAIFEDVRDGLALGPGRRLVCDSDTDKPRMTQSQVLDSQPSRGPARVRRCAVLAPLAEPSGLWDMGTIPTVAGPARLWLVFVEQGIGGRFRLAQLRFSAGRENWDKTATALAEVLGPGAAAKSRYISWQDSQHETLVFVDEKYPAEFNIVIDDLKLRRLLRSPGSSWSLD